MKKIAITGGIGSGKSYVSSLLEKRGYPVFSADELNRQALLKGHRGYEKVVAAFGAEILDETEEISKPTLAYAVFADDEKRRILEKIMHPIIMEELEKAMAECRCPFVFAEMPILFEAGLQDRFDASILVIADEETIFDRLETKRGMSKESASRRMAKQMPQKEKEGLADYIIDNSRKAMLEKQLDELLKELEERTWI